MKKGIVVIVLFLVGFAAFMANDLRSYKYPELNKCFKATVSGKTLCNKSMDYVQLSRVSPYFLEAVIMSEDDKFYYHNGFDWKEFKNSLLVNLRKFSFVRGGSTITQQLVKNVYLDQSKSISRKVKEAYIANQIEGRYSKKLILEKYVNAIQFGKGLWGIKEAADFYFGVHPEDLGVLESLYLVILLPSPVKYSASYRNDKLTDYQKRRIKRLLKRLKKRGDVDPDYADFLEEDIENFPWGGKSLMEEEPLDHEI
ncbi:MAG: biosynthetic peptidoglycan transglycosylase [Bdellovibrionales bacterium]